MPRPARYSPADLCCHVINRGNGRAAVFHKDADYEAFLRILSLGCERHDMRLLAWCLMPNHFHFVAWPRGDDDLPRMMQWATTCHVRRYHRHYKTTGHVWQGRYKSFPIQGGGSLLSVLRYVERNPVRAGLVKRAQDWAWSSAAAWLEKGAQGSGSVSARLKGSGTNSLREMVPVPMVPDPVKLDGDFTRAARPIESWLQLGPVKRPEPWLKFVNHREEAAELEAIRESVNRGAPFGNPKWREKTAAKLGLDSTMRPRGRPPKRAKK
ncbi:MAG: transposase [Planctomycetes bacterium]|nr:transposase [Planctomycetota bacterium]MCA8945568.1 transposase [Planctomycetota bacterium]